MMNTTTFFFFIAVESAGVCTGLYILSSSSREKNSGSTKTFLLMVRIIENGVFRISDASAGRFTY